MKRPVLFRPGILVICLGVAAAFASPLAGQSISSAANQTFVVGNPPTDMSTITITDAATPKITAANDIRIRIPSGFSMTWNTALTTATIGGPAASKVSTTVSYEDAGRTLVLDVTTNFAGNDEITVSGPQFMNFTATEANKRLQLVVAGAGGATAANDAKTINIVAPAIASGANQTFTVGDAPTSMSQITITDANPATITAANDIRIRIPSTFNMTWNTALTTATIGGAAASNVSTTVSYEDGGKTLVLNVTTNFAAGDKITVSGLQYGNFSAPSAADNLELVIAGAGGGTADVDSHTITIEAPTISSAANQTFTVGQAATAMSTITITDDNPPTITAANDIRIRIPSTFNMTWNTGLTTATIGGPQAGKVSTTVGYEDGGKTLVLNVTGNFAKNDQITVSGLQFKTFTAASAADHLQLVVSGAGGGTAAADDKTITILGYGASVTPHSTSANQLPSNGTNYALGFTVQNTGRGVHHGERGDAGLEPRQRAAVQSRARRFRLRHRHLQCRERGRRLEGYSHHDRPLSGQLHSEGQRPATAHGRPAQPDLRQGRESVGHAASRDRPDLHDHAHEHRHEQRRKRRGRRHAAVDGPVQSRERVQQPARRRLGRRRVLERRRLYMDLRPGKRRL